MRAVVIESRPEVVAELKSIFQDFKIELTLWSDKGSGWQKEFRAARPDIVFIDHLVNGRDGLKCLEMAIDMTNAPFYVFMHSFRGLRANDLEEKAFTLGADIVLQKPLVRSRLKTAISRLIRLREGNHRKMTLVMKE